MKNCIVAGRGYRSVVCCPFDRFNLCITNRSECHYCHNGSLFTGGSVKGTLPEIPINELCTAPGKLITDDTYSTTDKLYAGKLEKVIEDNFQSNPDIMIKEVNKLIYEYLKAKGNSKIADIFGIANAIDDIGTDEMSLEQMKVWCMVHYCNTCDYNVNGQCKLKTRR